MAAYYTSKRMKKPKATAAVSKGVPLTTATIRATAPDKSAATGYQTNTTGNARSGQDYQTRAVRGGVLHVYKSGPPVFVKKKQPKLKTARATTRAGASTTATGQYF